MIAKTSVKGQIIIPAKLRKKYSIKKGTRVMITDGEGDVILVRPIPDDPVEESRGILKGKTSIIKALIKDRREEAKRG
jgi:AbrB family looped-hinge helix DNA binding protein